MKLVYFDNFKPDVLRMSSGSVQSPRASVGEHCRVFGAAAESLSFLRRRASAGVGMIARRMGELGAETPW